MTLEQLIRLLESAETDEVALAGIMQSAVSALVSKLRRVAIAGCVRTERPSYLTRFSSG